MKKCIDDVEFLPYAILDATRDVIEALIIAVLFLGILKLLDDKLILKFGRHVVLSHKIVQLETGKQIYSPVRT